MITKFRITKSAAIVLLAATVSAGVTGIGLAGGAASASAGKDQSRIAADYSLGFADRWAGAAVSVASTKTDRAPACANEDWPFISADCLALAGGAEPRPAVRYVTIETPAANGSVLTRMPAPQIASR